MKKLLTALLLTLTVFVTGCSANKPTQAADNGSPSAGLISSHESDTDSESYNSERSSSIMSVASASDSSAETSINIPNPSSETTDNKSVQSVPQSTATVSSQSSSSSSSSVLPPQSAPESTPPESITQSELTEETSYEKSIAKTNKNQAASLEGLKGISEVKSLKTTLVSL